MSATPHSIIVVDDDVDTCRNLSDILSDLGYQVDTANDGPSALELVRKKTYDIALLDLKMPGMDGLELYREIKKLQAATVAMVVTAYAGATTAEEAMSAGAWRVLPKPVDLPKLMGLVDQALGQPMVMIVDDDPDLCANMWDLLRERGYRVSLAHSEREAASLLKDRDYKVVLIDMKLPEGDGTTVFKLVRDNKPEARTILITAHRSELNELVQKVVAEGADAVCYKPFDIGRLIETVNNLAREEKGKVSHRS